VPDLVNISLDLVLDKEKGIFHATNAGYTSWADLAMNVVQMMGGDLSLIKAVPVEAMHLKAKRPHYSVLQSEKGISLTSFEDALERYIHAYKNLYQSLNIAV
jgi:dTDP-4-dehydrorhamnose reductase